MTTPKLVWPCAAVLLCVSALSARAASSSALDFPAPPVQAQPLPSCIANMHALGQSATQAPGAHILKVGTGRVETGGSVQVMCKITVRYDAENGAPGRTEEIFLNADGNPVRRRAVPSAL